MTLHLCPALQAETDLFSKKGEKGAGIWVSIAQSETDPVVATSPTPHPTLPHTLAPPPRAVWSGWQTDAQSPLLRLSNPMWSEARLASSATE